MQNNSIDSAISSHADNQYLESSLTKEDDPIMRIDRALQRISSAVNKTIEQKQQNLGNIPNVITQQELFETIRTMQRELLTNVNALLLNMQHLLNALTPHRPSNHTSVSDNPRKEKE